MVLKIQYVVTRQWLKLHPPNFHTITYLQNHLLYKNQAAKFPAILDSFFYLVLTVSGEFQHGGWR